MASRVTTRKPHHHPFGNDTFGRWAEGFARWFGTPGFIVGQSLFVVGWITLNVVGAIHHWDAYPFILLNLAFSTQAAYAAPLILLAQTRQANRDHIAEQHRDRMEDQMGRHVTETHRLITQNTNITANVHDLLRLNTDLTTAIDGLVRDLHDRGRPSSARTA